MRKVTTALCKRRHRSQTIHCGVVIDLVIIEVEERLVLQDRAADRTAEIIEPDTVFRDRATGEVIRFRVIRVILVVLIRRAVEAISAALTDLVEEDAANPVLRGERRSADLDFLHDFEDIRVCICRAWQGRLGTIGQDGAVANFH